MDEGPTLMGLRKSCSLIHHPKYSSFKFLQIGNDLEEVLRLRIALRTEHAHEYLWRAAKVGSEFDKTDRAVNVFAEYRFSGLHIASEHAADAFLQQRPTEAGAVPQPLIQCLIKSLGWTHAGIPSSFAYIPAKDRVPFRYLLADASWSHRRVESRCVPRLSQDRRDIRGRN